MKKTFINFMVVITMMTIPVLISSCSNEEEYQLCEAQVISQKTRSPELDHKLDERTVKIIKADMLGALEGFLKGVNYAVDKGLNEDEAIGVIITSAISHAVIRSQQADQKLGPNFPSQPFPYESGNYDYASSSNANDFISLSDQVLYTCTRSDLQFVPLVADNIPITNYQNAAYVGKMHNAILPELKSGISIDFTVSTSSYSEIQKKYLQSEYFKESIELTYNKPTDFSKYYEYDMSDVAQDPNFRVNIDIINFLVSIDNYSEITLFQLDQLISEKFECVGTYESWTEYEKEAMRTALMTAAYSAEYWTLINPNPSWGIYL